MVAPLSLDGVLRRLVREEVGSQIPAIAEAVVNVLRAEGSPVGAKAEHASSYVTVADAATRLGVAAKTVRRWIREGKLHGVSAGRLLRIDSRELERFATARDGEPADVEALAANLLAKRKR